MTMFYPLWYVNSPTCLIHKRRNLVELVRNTEVYIEYEQKPEIMNNVVLGLLHRGHETPKLKAYWCGTIGIYQDDECKTLCSGFSFTDRHVFQIKYAKIFYRPNGGGHFQGGAEYKHYVRSLIGVTNTSNSFGWFTREIGGDSVWMELVGNYVLGLYNDPQWSTLITTVFMEMFTWGRSEFFARLVNNSKFIEQLGAIPSWYGREA